MIGALRRVAVPATLFVVTAMLGGGCDLSTKEWAERRLSEEPGQTMSVVDPYVDLTLAYNEGTAFSVVSDLGTGRAILGGLALLVVVVLFFVAIRRPQDRLYALALGTIAGGAIGNGVDRIVRAGVVDFIQVNYPWGGSWPTFNIADALVAVGVGLLLYHAWKTRGSTEPDPAVMT